MLYGLIMAGGTGTRLWPQSRVHHPKQLLKLAGDESMFQHAVYRLDPLFSADKVFVVAREDLISDLNEHVPEIPGENFIVEPQGRGTAPAIGLGAIHLYRRDPNAVMAVLTADHFIRKIDDFQNTLSAAADLADTGHLVTMGIKPTYPSTGFGYIQQGDDLGEVKGLHAYKVERFTEKPDQDTALSMLAGGDHTWNSGMFIWRVDRILEEFETQMPDFYAKLMRIADVLGTPEYVTILDELWPTVEKETIDYGIMEHAEDVAVLPVDIGWTDVGSWSAVADLREADDDGNIIEGQHVGVDTHDTMILGGKRMITTIGLDNVIVIDTDDAILICAKGHEQDVKEIVNALKNKGRPDLL